MLFVKLFYKQCWSFLFPCLSVSLFLGWRKTLNCRCAIYWNAEKKNEVEITEKSTGEGQGKDEAMIIFKTYPCRQLCNRKTECRVLAGRNRPCNRNPWVPLSWGNLSQTPSLLFRLVKSCILASTDYYTTRLGRTGISACAAFWEHF